MKKAVLLWSAMVIACEGGCSEVASASAEEAIPSPEETAGGAGEPADVVCHVRGSDVSGALKIPQVSIEELSLRDAQELLSAQSSAHEVLLSQEQVCSPDVQKTLLAREKLALEIHFVGFDEATLASCLQPLHESLCSLELLHLPLHDAGLGQLSGLTNLTRLSLQETQISDAGLAHLSSLPNLTELNLHRTQVSDAGLAHLSSLPSLTYIGLGLTQITDAGLMHLSSISNLTGLSVWNTQVSDAGLAHLSPLTSLRVLGLGSTRITDAGLTSLPGLTSLTNLSFSNTGITDAGLTSLSGLTSLNFVNLKSTNVTRAGISELQASLPGCRIMN